MDDFLLESTPKKALGGRRIVAQIPGRGERQEAG